MLEACKKKIREQRIKNIDLLHGDLSTEQTLKDLDKYKGEIGYICLFNILYCEYPLDLLNAAHHILDTN
jgi:hypothetical protein